MFFSFALSLATRRTDCIAEEILREINQRCRMPAMAQVPDTGDGSSAGCQRWLKCRIPVMAQVPDTGDGTSAGCQ